MKTKKIMSLLITALMMVTVFSGCGNGGSGANNDTQGNTTTQSNESSADTTAEASADNSNTNTNTNTNTNSASSEVKILTGVTGGKDDEEMAKFQESLSKATGLNVIMEKPSDYSNTLIQKLQSGEKYDLIYLNQKELLSLNEQEVLSDITDKVKNSKILTDNIDPKEWKDIEIDGKYYAGFNKKEIFIPVLLNKKHLEQAGVDYKTIEPTLDGYYNVFKKLKETIKTPQYYPFDIVLNENWDLQPWMASANIKGGVIKDSDGKTYVPYATDTAAPVWEWLAKLYAEELLDPSCAVDKTKDTRSKLSSASQLISVCTDWIAWGGMQNKNAEASGVSSDDYEIVMLPGVKTPDGNYMLRKGNASLWGIPVNANNPDGAFKVLEYFATQEGGMLLSVGIEGVDYTKDGDKITLTDTGAAHLNDHGAPFPINKNFENPLGYNPGIEDALSLEQYASIETPIQNEQDYKEIVGKWGVMIVKGDTSVADGLKNMREELVSRGVCEK